MKRLILLLFVLMLPLVSGHSLYVDLANVYNMSNDPLLDSFGDLNADTIVASVETGVGGFNEESFGFPGTNGNYVGWNDSVWDDKPEISMSMWVNWSNPGNQGYLYFFSPTFIRIDDAGNLIRFAIANQSGDTLFVNTQGMTLGRYELFTWTYNGSHFKAYLNNTLILNRSIGGNLDLTRSLLGSKDGATHFPFEGNMDEFYVWNRELTTQDIANLYSEGNGFFYPWNQTITVDYPSNIRYNDYDGWINVTTEGNLTCVLNNSDWVQQTLNNTLTHKFYNSGFASLSDGAYSLLVDCTIATNPIDFTIDKTVPTVASVVTNNDSFFSALFDAQFNYTDVFELFKVNITFNGVLRHNKSNIGAATYSFTDAYNITDLDIGNYVVNTTMCDDTDEGVALNCDNQTFLVSRFNENYSASAVVVENSLEQIKLVLEVVNVSAHLFATNIVYNGTVYAAGSSDNSTDQVNHTFTVNVPTFAAATPVYFYFNYTIDGHYFVSSEFSQSGQIGSNIVNCTGGQNETLFINIFSENFPARAVNATLEVYGLYGVDLGVRGKNISLIYPSNSSHVLCIDNSTNIFATLQLKYTTNPGFTHNYYFVNHSFNATAQTLNLYNFNQTGGVSDLKITVRERTTYDELSNVYGSLQRLYPGEGVWRTVQMAKSGDFGLLFYNIIEESEQYRLIFKDDVNNLLRTTDELSFSCDNDICDVTILLDPFSGVSAGDVAVTWSFDEVTNIVTVNWNNPSGTDVIITSELSKNSDNGQINICDDTVTAPSGTLTCDLTGHNGIIRLRVYSEASPFVAAVTEFIDKRLDPLYDFVDADEANFWNFGIGLVVAGIGAVSPVFAIIGLIVSVIFMYVLGTLKAVSIGWVALCAVIGIAIALKVRK